MRGEDINDHLEKAFGEDSDESSDSSTSSGLEPAAWMCIDEVNHYEVNIFKDTWDAEDFHNIKTLFAASDLVQFGRELLSEVASKALTYLNTQIIHQVNGSIEEQEKAVEAIHQGNHDEAVEILCDNIQHMLEQKDYWMNNMEEVADEEVQKLESSLEVEE